MAETNYTIKEVTNMTGISKEALRIWERRYNFPQPLRDASGDRIYTPEDVEKISLVRRLLEYGKRPGAITSLSLPELKAMISEFMNEHHYEISEDHQRMIQLLQDSHPELLLQFMENVILRIGLKNFIFDFLQVANSLVGDLWEQGKLSIFQEHLYSEYVKDLLLRSTGKFQETNHNSPKILLTTLEGEMHQLGLLMVHTLLRLEKYPCIYLGPNLPLSDIASAIQSFHPQICLLSLSSNFDKNLAKKMILDLHHQFPNIEIWIGGKSGGQLNIKNKQICLHRSLADLSQTLDNFKQKEKII